MYKVMIAYLSEMDQVYADELGPVFKFETITEAIPFIELCFKNGYDVYIKSEEESED